MMMMKPEVFEWFKLFQEGHEDLQDDPRTHPSASQNADTIANVHEMVM
jgi:hypothetical protein